MKKQKLLLIILTSLFITNSSYAEFAVGGDYSCGNIINYDKEDNFLARNLIIIWYQGFASGANWESKNDNLNTLPDDNSIYYSILKYCKDNPLHYGSEASINTYQELNNY